MKNVLLTFLALFFCTTLFAQDFGTKWSNGYKVESDDGNFKLKFGGRVMMDWAFISHDDDLTNYLDAEGGSGYEFRRIRFFNSGTIYKAVKYKVQLDFSGGEVTFKDVYLELPKLPVGDLRLGHFKEPFRLEALTSSKYMTFMERSQHIPFSPERNSGIMIKNEVLDKMIGYQFGFFHNGDKAGDDGAIGDGYNITARVTALPFKNAEKNQLLHVGAGFSYRKPSSETYKVSTRPESHLAEKFVSTGTIEGVNSSTLFNAEVALVVNSLSVQGEFLSAAVDATQEDNFSAFYAQASYFLTGEHRPYKNAYEGFSRVKPKNNFGQGGMGAWELAVRYSNINLDGDLTNGGQLSDITLGVNWYLNPATRFMLNYVIADVKDVGKANIFQIRGQIDF